MIFSCNKCDIQKALSITIKATSSKLQKSILECVLIIAVEDKVVLKAFDGVTGITATIYADVSEEGSVLLTARHLADLINKMGDGEVTFNGDDSKTVVSSKNASATFGEINADLFQDIPSVSGDRFLIPRCDFAMMIAGVSFCAYNGNDNQLLTGVLFHATADGMRMVSSDKVRLALASRSVGVDKEVKIVIPAKTLQDIAGISEGEGDVELYTSDNAVFLNIDNIAVYSRLFEGEYFDYTRIVPVEYTTRVRVETALLQNSIDIASVMSRDDLNNLISINVAQGVMEVTAGSEYGEVRDEIPIYMEGEVCTMSFNGRLFGEILKNVKEESIFIDLAGKFKPCKITPADNDSFLYLIVSVNKPN